MATIISAEVFTVRDVAGNDRTEGWLLVEYRDASYSAGGEVMSLTNHFRRVSQVLAFPTSGALNFHPRVNLADLPANGLAVGSLRLQLWGLGSSAITVNTSGVGVGITSGQTLVLAAQSNVGQLFSGFVAAQATGWVATDRQDAEIAAATAVSGARALLHVLGY